ncbi:MAG: hypothetical protein ACI39G_05835 [Pseudoramibacter sp.]
MTNNILKQYDKVLLKDGRTATIVEILGDGDEYIVDVDLKDDWDTIAVMRQDIKKRINYNTY